MEVSIILSVFNGEKTIRKMIDSVISQTFNVWELIVVNDGSKDDTLSIIEDYRRKDSRIKIITKPNGGLGSARVSGIKASQGDYIINIDADDWLEPDYVESLLKGIKKAEADILWCDIIDNDETNHIWRFNDGLDKDLLVRKMLLRKIWVPQWNRIIRREIALKNMKYLEGLQQWEDMVFNVACILCSSKISYLPKALYHYYVNNPESLCNTALTRNMIPEYKRAIHNLGMAFEDYKVATKYQYEFNYNKLYTIRDYVDDNRFVDYEKFVDTYPEAIVHIWDYPQYPMRLKICSWLILHKVALFVPLVCKVDVVLRRFGLSKQA